MPGISSLQGRSNRPRAGSSLQMTRPGSRTPRTCTADASLGLAMHFALRLLPPPTPTLQGLLVHMAQGTGLLILQPGPAAEPFLTPGPTQAGSLLTPRMLTKAAFLSERCPVSRTQRGLPGITSFFPSLPRKPVVQRHWLR